MSYLRFVWYRVQTEDGTIEAHRWAENASQPEGRLTLNQYHAQKNLKLLAGPFKTRKLALKEMPTDSYFARAVEGAIFGDKV